MNTRSGAKTGHRASVLKAAVVCVAGIWLGACNHTPAAPEAAPLAAGRWSGDIGCLAVTEPGCNLVVGCGHGQFPRPIVARDGTFDVTGTYRIEIGPISIEPAPSARYVGSVSGSRLILTVTPSATGLMPASYSLTLGGTGTCSVPCL